MYHKTLTQEQWNILPTVEQLGNIGSEVSRAIIWRSKNSEYMKRAVYRALELLDLSVGDNKNVSSLKEILRVRECLADYFLGDNMYAFTDDWWQKYFLDYAGAARRDT
jgi:hypothetical protein